MREMRRRFWRNPERAAIVAFLGALFLARAAHASGLTHVAYVGDDAELSHALSVALSSWHVEVTGTTDTQLGGTLPEAANAADALCARTGAQAAVWISKTPSGRALWVYDARSRELISRPVTEEPPYDGAVAAALALAAKTLLKKSFVAPETERFGAPPPGPPPPPPALPPPPPDPASTWFLEGGGGARFFAISTQPADARFGLGVSFWPRRSAFGAFVDVAFGPGAHVITSDVDAHLLTFTSALGARARLDVARWLALETGLGFVFDVASFSGVAAGANVSVLRLNPGARLSFVADWKLGPRTSLGLVNALDGSFRRQDYTLGGATVAEGGFVSWQVGLRLRVGAD